VAADTVPAASVPAAPAAVPLSEVSGSVCALSCVHCHCQSRTDAIIIWFKPFPALCMTKHVRRA
jgi:hypothetical protein